ncbi:hypothetical protein [Nocardioides sp. SYSU D00065]|uniref:hypothetical protein n=1 Tax=Nocardioides sp. SYSU D00065 TaxID=2817378 RepID=UPI001B33B8DF|nr:hypothetical protein [Nocardioides sp. SYSU D00065]
MRGRWLAAGALVVATGCGEVSGAPTVEPLDAASDEPVRRPTAVPGAEGRVVTSTPVVVTDDGSGAHLCFSNATFGGGVPDPLLCDDVALAGWDWDRHGGAPAADRGVRAGTYELVGTFDGATFTVEEASPPDPSPDDWDFEIPCPTPTGGWRVPDPNRVTQDDYLRASALAQELDGFAMAAVSTPDGSPGPRDPANTVLSVYVAGDPAAAEAAVREVWGGMLCVTGVERSAEELEEIQMRLVRLDLPGVTEVGGNLDNEMELAVFHDDGSIQRWADREFGDGVVVVESNLQPASAPR